ncbi:hypothetical protein MBANPS3_012240 [Mucor bainieri]
MTATQFQEQSGADYNNVPEVMPRISGSCVRANLSLTTIYNQFNMTEEKFNLDRYVYLGSSYLTPFTELVNISRLANHFALNEPISPRVIRGEHATSRGFILDGINYSVQDLNTLVLNCHQVALQTLQQHIFSVPFPL